MSLKQKILLLATIPLILVIAVITYVVNNQAAALARQEIAVFEQTMLNAKKAELLNYISLALTSIDHLYNRPPPRSAEDEANAQDTVRKILNRLTYGTDGYFFVYDYKGNNIVHPKQTWRVGNNYWDLEDRQGRKVIQNLIREGRQGGGFYRYSWEQPSSGNVTDKIGYAVSLERWRWMLGTGIYIDDVVAHVQHAKAEVNDRIQHTFILIAAITLGAVMCVFVTGLVINIRESSLADAKLQALTQKVFDTQEEERGRVARELHDSISQILVSVKFALERAQLLSSGLSQPAVLAIDKAEDHLNLAIQEVRRISHDLRPGILDDLGLSKALENLAEEFSNRTGVDVTVEAPAFKNLLPSDAKTALYRIAQESLTNIERHARASRVDLGLFLGQNGVTLRVSDNGTGFDVEQLGKKQSSIAGIGLKNMQERIEQFRGHFEIISDAGGTVIQARLPNSLMQAPAAGA